MAVVNIRVGSRYMTGGQRVAEVVSEVMGTAEYIGFVSNGTRRRPVIWDDTGCAVSDGSSFVDNLEEQVIPGFDQWNQLSTSDQDAVRRIVRAFNDKKITGVKILRGTYGWGLLEAKNIFEQALNWPDPIDMQDNLRRALNRD